MVPDDALLLTDLCKICNNAKPKYCCPRCSTRTCSLPCYKRHKLWSSCSGKRDPAAYVKRNQLATPGGIDHDYNFLTGIERSFDRADHNAERQGIPLDEAAAKSGGVKLEQGLREARVIVQKAPRGMSRQKENHTEWNGKTACLNWTVEWMMQDGQRKLRNSLESMTVVSAHDDLLAQRSSHKKRKHHHRTAQASTTVLDRNAPNRHDTSTLLPLPDAKTTIPDPSTSDGSDKALLGKIHYTHESVSDASANPITPDGEPPQRYYYLHIPGTPSASRVVTHLPQATTLRSALSGRTVYEFPTIYVLSEPPHRLPQPFVTERNWAKTKSGIVDLDPISEKSSALVGDSDEALLGITSVDEDSVMMRLRRDVGIDLNS